MCKVCRWGGGGEGGKITQVGSGVKGGIQQTVPSCPNPQRRPLIAIVFTLFQHFLFLFAVPFMFQVPVVVSFSGRPAG